MPKSIKYFERYYIAGLALTLVSSLFLAEFFTAEEGVVGVVGVVGVFDVAGVVGVVVVVLTLCAFLGIELALVLFTSRMRSNIAKWILIIVFALGVSGVVESFKESVVNGVVEVLCFFFRALAVQYLFQKDSREWFNKKKQQAPDQPAAPPPAA